MDVAFLTGATGFVGANLARLLLEKGLRVRALVRKDSNRNNIADLDLDIIEGGIDNLDALARGCAGARYIFHVAADYRVWVKKPEEMYTANVQGTINVLRTGADAHAERIVYCSSVAAVRPPNTHTPSNEESHYTNIDAVVGHYKKSKFLADKAARDLAAQGLPIVIVNPAAPIGPYDIKPTPTGRIVVDFMNGRIPSYIDTGLNVVHVADVALGHWLAAQKGRIGERYILGGENMTLKAILETLASITGLPGPKFKTPYCLAYTFSAFDTALAHLRGAPPWVASFDAVKMAKHYMWFDSSKARHELGYNPRPVRQAFKDAADWFTAHGYVKISRHT